MAWTDALLTPGRAWTEWLALMRDQFTEPRGTFWWPTLAAAAVGLLLVALAARRTAAVKADANANANVNATSPASAAPLCVRAMLRELPVDLGCFAAYTYLLVMMGPLLLLVAGFSAAGLFLVFGVPAARTAPAGLAEQVILAALVFILSDFMLYWSHRLFHAVRPLFRLHRLHHGPAVLTPLTAFRFWPPEAAVHFLAFNIGSGLGIGLACLAFGTGVTQWSFAGVNLFALAWYLAFSHLRHSHVPLRFPRWLSHLLVSPQMHQAHHSVQARHHDRNFGTALAVWDWMFGTLVIPEAADRFEFGV